MPGLIRIVSSGLVLLSLVGCAGLANLPATVPSTDVNPITGQRGGNGLRRAPGSRRG